MAIGLYPGSFDPATFGHLDVIKRASKIVDKLYVAVLLNSEKNALFTAEERCDLLRKITAGIPNVEVLSYSGLTVELARQYNATVMIRGLRAVTDFEYELSIAQTNHAIAPEIDTIFLTTNLKYAYLSSSTVKEVGFYEGDISHFVPEEIIDIVKEKINKKKLGLI
ncbi:MAG: pantetheine-phosphate adenylyltransferase [Lachnospiraceae bacterium]|nr:pantetheine-phosphate adenylyltransferase [Lachnospiraceae bacterium]